MGDVLPLFLNNGEVEEFGTFSVVYDKLESSLDDFVFEEVLLSSDVLVSLIPIKGGDKLLAYLQA